jgi:hypothetical protein
MRAIFSSALTLGIGAAALVVSGCGQGAGSPEVTATSVPGADQALTAVEACQDQVHACFTDGGGMVCEQQLRSCLSAILPDGGGPSEAHGGPDASGPSSPPGQGDAGRSHSDIDDAGSSHPTRPDAAVAALTKPVGNDGGSPVLPCVDQLRDCLATAAKPDTCAAAARTCLDGVVDSKRPDAAGPH